MDKRHIWPNYLRALATIAVVMLHVSSPILNKYNELSMNYWNIGNFFDSLTRFSVPVFFMLSGALLLNKDYTLKDFIKKRFIRIIPPFLFWSCCYMVYDSILENKTFDSIMDLVLFVIQNLFFGSQFHLWFIYTIMGLYLFVPILRKWIKSSTTKEMLYFLVIWLVTIIYNTPEIRKYLPRINLINFSGYLGYFVLGYFLTQLKPPKKYISVLLIVIGVCVTFFGTYLLTVKSTDFKSYFYGYLTPNVLMVAIGVFLLIRGKKIRSKLANNIVQIISNYSFGIYLSHVLILNVLAYYGFNWSFTHPVLSIPLVSLITISLCTVLIHFGKKIKFLSMLVD